MRSNAYVLTGAPGVGKSSTLTYLGAVHGYGTLREAARDVIEADLARGLTLAEIRSDELRFQHRVFSLQKEREAQLNGESITFLDRGVHDTLAFLALNGLPPEDWVLQTCVATRYRRVFLLTMLPLYEVDHARLETREQAARIEGLLLAAYKDHVVTIVPPMPIAHRVNLIRSML